MVEDSTLIPENNMTLIEDLLHEFNHHLGIDYTKYRNHVYRVFQLCLARDPDPNKTDKYAIASVFHDIGIWTDKTFDYLDPSEKLAREWLVKHGRQNDADEIIMMIRMHHKITRYKGEYANAVEVFRKADWTDLSFGLIRFGMPRRIIRSIKKEFPTRGFHRFLARKVMKNLFIHPLNPLPMFKR